jgi:hypothetical protein
MIHPPEVIDAISLAGNRAKVNDDTYGAAGSRVWVIDGATGLGDPLLPGHSDAAWIARTTNRLLHTHHAIRDTAILMKTVIAGVADAFAAERIRMPEARWQLPFCSLLMATFEETEIETVWLGDCRGIIRTGNQLLTCGETPDGTDEERDFATQLGRGLGASAMLRSPEVIQALRDSRDTFNTGQGRWVLGIEPEAANHMQRAMFPRSGPVHALLMSDGFSAMELKYGRYSAADLLQACHDRGLARVGAELRKIEETEDPDGRIWPRFKQSDDATAVLITA